MLMVHGFRRVDLPTNHGEEMAKKTADEPAKEPKDNDASGGSSAKGAAPRLTAKQVVDKAMKEGGSCVVE